MRAGWAGEERLRQLLWDGSSVVQEVVGHYFIQVWASLRISRQDSCDKVTGCIRNVDVLGERVAVLPNSAVRGFDISGLKGWFSNDESVDDDTEGPDVNLVGVTALAFKHFWRDIVGSTANRAFFLAIEVEFGGETEIAQLDLHLVVEEEIAEFEIAMDDAMRVQILQRVNDLHRVALHFQLVQTLSSL